MHVSDPSLLLLLLLLPCPPVQVSSVQHSPGVLLLTEDVGDGVLLCLQGARLPLAGSVHWPEVNMGIILCF